MDTPCIETSGRRDRWGYGQCGVRRYGKLIQYTHRLAWVEAHGQLPPAETPYILHHCDNPPCINPEHLYAGTAADNKHDEISRGRSAHQVGKHWNQLKTHCPTGHEYTADNTYYRGRWRRCRECQCAQTRRYYRRRKEAS